MPGTNNSLHSKVTKKRTNTLELQEKVKAKRGTAKGTMERKEKIPGKAKMTKTTKVPDNNQRQKRKPKGGQTHPSLKSNRTSSRRGGGLRLPKEKPVKGRHALELRLRRALYGVTQDTR